MGEVSLDRRAMLTAAPASIAVMALPSMAGATQGEDPILSHYQEWCEAKAEWFRWSDAPGNGNWDFPESIRAEEREDAAFNAMMRTPALTMDGIAALVHVIWSVIAPACRADTPEFVEACERYELRPVLWLWQNVTGSGSPPPIFLPPSKHPSSRPLQTMSQRSASEKCDS